MDDDYFGGFEAADIFFKDGNGEPQKTSPAIPWAAFSTVPEILVPPTVSAELLLEQAPANVPADTQLSPNTLSATDLKEQVPLSINPPLTESQEKASANYDETDTKPRLSDSEKHVQQTLSALESKLQTADEEKARIKKELEDLLEKHRTLETNYLKEKDEKLISHKDIYNKLQEKHKLELEDLRKAGHEALSIIVEEFKALLKVLVEEREKALEKQYVSAVEKQAQKCEELLNAQHQRLLDMLEEERKTLEEKNKESLLLQSQEYKDMLEKCMENERERNEEALTTAAQVEKEDLQAAILAAVTAERENMKKLHDQEKELWQAERNKDREKIAVTVEEAVERQKQSSEEMVKAAILQEQRKSERAVEEAVKQTREELIEYIKEQKRLDQVIRQRSLSSLELFLSCAQKQLNCLLREEVTAAETEGNDSITLATSLKDAGD
ncbi:coiled-coil domain-containing protein 91 isoform X1 [Notechis scutatus]|uniref:Coiled-coil domain-containing protein 91 isoform X1 n=1 Tax=Notechis scutatus TaxID=8663 RepID=A0A6J1V5J0_9SAUR|nr:coiled-coil domain-containing protein 91 isoform X1 [Notechis scutatus]XP_026535063.1 coiled-coil domain-containing protein 91 isoform X1 [Notechis scutatus]XP_026535064.1 coiled-coil domain-containing protein 91 isoform X1 [Notechis scutatus]